MFKLSAKIFAALMVVCGAYLYGYFNGRSSEFDVMLFTLGSNAATFRVMLKEKGSEETIRWHEPTDEAYISGALLAYGRNFQLGESYRRYIYPDFSPVNNYQYKNIAKYYESNPFNPKWEEKFIEYYQSESAKSDSWFEKYGYGVLKMDAEEILKQKLIAVRELKIPEASNKSLKDAP